MWDEKGISPVRYNLPKEADSVMISIYDENGDLVRQASVDGREGPGQFQWDGTDDEGRQREPAHAGDPHRLYHPTETAQGLHGHQRSPVGPGRRSRHKSKS